MRLWHERRLRALQGLRDEHRLRVLRGLRDERRLRAQDLKYIFCCSVHLCVFTIKKYGGKRHEKAEKN